MMKNFTVEYASGKVIQVAARNHNDAGRIAQDMHPKDTVVLIFKGNGKNFKKGLKILHYGIGWDINAKDKHCLSFAVCDKINDSEILFTSEINEKNISKSIIELIRGSINVNNNSTFTLAINNSVNNDVKIKEEVIKELKSKLAFKEIKDFSNEQRTFLDADSLSLHEKTKKKFENIFPEWIFSKKRGERFEAEICSVIAIYFQFQQFEAILPALKISRIDKLKMLSEKNKISRVNFKKPDYPYLIPNDDFGQMLPGTE